MEENKLHLINLEGQTYADFISVACPASCNPQCTQVDEKLTKIQQLMYRKASDIGILMESIKDAEYRNYQLLDQVNDIKSSVEGEALEASSIRTSIHEEVMQMKNEIISMKEEVSSIKDTNIQLKNEMLTIKAFINDQVLGEVSGVKMTLRMR